MCTVCDTVDDIVYCVLHDVCVLQVVPSHNKFATWSAPSYQRMRWPFIWGHALCPRSSRRGKQPGLLACLLVVRRSLAQTHSHQVFAIF